MRQVQHGKSMKHPWNIHEMCISVIVCVCVCAKEYHLHLAMSQNPHNYTKIHGLVGCALAQSGSIPIDSPFEYHSWSIHDLYSTITCPSCLQYHLIKSQQSNGLWRMDIGISTVWLLKYMDDIFNPYSSPFKYIVHGLSIDHTHFSGIFQRQATQSDPGEQRAAALRSSETCGDSKNTKPAGDLQVWYYELWDSNSFESTKKGSSWVGWSQLKTWQCSESDGYPHYWMMSCKAAFNYPRWRIKNSHARLLGTSSICGVFGFDPNTT